MVNGSVLPTQSLRVIPDGTGLSGLCRLTYLRDLFLLVQGLLESYHRPMNIKYLMTSLSFSILK